VEDDVRDHDVRFHDLIEQVRDEQHEPDELGEERADPRPVRERDGIERSGDDAGGEGPGEQLIEEIEAVAGDDAKAAE
jgi:hypothetical protein